jgi:hypothetical protein
MMNADYTKKLDAVHAQRRENEAFQKGFDQSCERAAKDTTGMELRKLLRRMGLGQAADNMTATIAHEYAQLETMTEGERRSWLRARQLEEELETAREQQRMNQESARDRKRREQSEAFNRELGNLTPTALQRAGLKGTPTERKAYVAALRVLLAEPGAKLTLDLCTQAALSARDETEEGRRQYQTELGSQQRPGAPQRPAQPAQQQPAFPARRAAPAPVGSGASTGTSSTGGTARDFRKFIAGRTR